MLPVKIDRAEATAWQRWRPRLTYAAAGAGVALLILWLLGRKRSRRGALYATERIRFRIDKGGISYEGNPVADAAGAVAVARAARPVVVEVFATGEAVSGTVRALRDGLIKAGFTVVGNDLVTAA